MDTTVTARRAGRVKHALYGKIVTKSSKYARHGREQPSARKATWSRSSHGRKLSKTKAAGIEGEREGDRRLTAAPEVGLALLGLPSPGFTCQNFRLPAAVSRFHRASGRFPRNGSKTGPTLAVLPIARS
jgi:ribosomal protein S17